MEERQDHATRTISIVMIIALVGKVLGLYRDHLLAVYYGTGMAANAFNTASRIPRVFFDAVFASAISACFIPVFSEYLTHRGKKEAFRFGGNFLSGMTLLHHRDGAALCGPFGAGHPVRGAPGQPVCRRI